jgi:WD40 repeat protein
MSLWNVQTGTPIIMDEPISQFHDVAFSPDSSILALSEYRSLSLYNARNGELLLTLPAIHEAEISDLQVSSTGSLILTASEDGTIRLWGVGG